MHNYTEPTIVRSKRGHLVQFRFNGKKYQYKRGINRFKGKQREKEAEKLKKALSDLLKKNWNPETQQNHFNLIYADEAIKFALNKRCEKVAHKTKVGYSYAIKLLLIEFKKRNYDCYEIKEIKRSHVRECLKAMQESKSASNKWYNKYLGFIKAVFTELVHWDMIDTNPVFLIPSEKVERNEGYKVATKEEAQKIKEFLEYEYRNFYRLMVLEYHTGIRPAEMLSIKCKDVDMRNRVIQLCAEDTKTSQFRNVPMCTQVFELISELDLSNGNHYLFGTKGEYGKKVDYSKEYIPSLKKSEVNKISKRWNTLIQKGLGIDICFYSWKHYGANQKILAGMELDTLRELYGHNSKLMTLRYAKNVKEVYLRQIMDRSPDF